MENSKLDPTVAAIRTSPEFHANIMVHSGYQSAKRAAFACEETKTIISRYSNDHTGLSNTIIDLASQQIDVGYQHPDDCTIMILLLVLKELNPEKAADIAQKVISRDWYGNFHWTKAAALDCNPHIVGHWAMS